MTGTLPVPCLHPHRAAAASRLRLMFVASALLHLLFAAGLVSNVPRGQSLPAAAAAITARLEPPPAMVTAGPTSAERETPAAAPRMKPLAPLADRGRRVAVNAGTPLSQDAPPFALPQAPDPTYYAARELDVYPRPFAPLDLGRFAVGDDASAPIRLAVLIDEHGIVKDVIPVESVPPGTVDERLRALLATARFVPARKDGRAVKSRIVLSVEFARERREP